MIEFLYRTVLIGVGATALLDLWAVILERFFKIPAPKWDLVGRWFCHLTEGKVFHEDITLARAYPPRACRRLAGPLCSRHRLCGCASRHRPPGLACGADIGAGAGGRPDYRGSRLVSASARDGRRHRGLQASQCPTDPGAQHRRPCRFRLRIVRECPSHPLKRQLRNSINTQESESGKQIGLANNCIVTQRKLKTGST